MQKSRPILIIALIFSIHSYSQDLSQKVISNQGSSGTVNGITLDWTIGEPIVETVTTAAFIFTQGFHQPLLNSEILGINKENDLSVVIWPNPVNYMLNININNHNESELILKLFGVRGRFIKQISANHLDTKISINVSDLSSGIYFLHISSSNGLSYETHKIIKQ